jgi:acetyl esterase/lipase
VLVLHGGSEHGRERTSPTQTSYLRMLDFYVSLRRRSYSTAIYLLRFRVRGWNAAHGVPDPVSDARWALDELTRRHPGAPIALLGHSMGGRCAFAAAAHPAVVGVCGLAPWLPDAEPLPGRIGDTSYVIAHGTSDRMTSAPLSLAYAERLRAAGGHVARFELEGGRHSLLDRAGLWRRFAVRTTLGLVGEAPMPAGVAAALDGKVGRAGLTGPMDLALADP